MQTLEYYSSQSTDDLIGLSNAYTLSSILAGFYQAIDYKTANLGEHGLSPEERVIPAIMEFKSEVRNGGISQFLMNSSGRYRDVIVEHLQAIGCHKTAEIMQQALAKVLNVPVEDEKKLDALTRRDAKKIYGSGEDLSQALFEYIKANRSRIELLPRRRSPTSSE